MSSFRLLLSIIFIDKFWSQNAFVGDKLFAGPRPLRLSVSSGGQAASPFSGAPAYVFLSSQSAGPANCAFRSEFHCPAPAQWIILSRSSSDYIHTFWILTFVLRSIRAGRMGIAGILRSCHPYIHRKREGNHLKANLSVCISTIWVI
jgi:hypothetical protein